MSSNLAGCAIYYNRLKLLCPTLIRQSTLGAISEAPRKNGENIPNAQLIIYPDSNHGAPYQYPELFVKHATLFLDV